MNKKFFLLINILTIFSVCSFLFAEETANPPATSDNNQKTEILVLPEKYKTVKITLSNKDIFIKDLLPVLSKEAGIKLVSDKDFRVEERKVRIFAEDAYISSVMYSVADVTKFKWVLKDDDTYVLTYDEDIEPLISSLKDKSGKEIQKNNEAKREVNLDDLLSDIGSMSIEELELSNPIKYDCIKKGYGINAIRQLFDDVPELRKAIIKREPMDIKVKDLSQETKALLCDAFSTRFVSGQKREVSFVDDEAILSLAYDTTPYIGTPIPELEHKLSYDYFSLGTLQTHKDFTNVNGSNTMRFDVYGNPLPEPPFHKIDIPNTGDETLRESTRQQNVHMATNPLSTTGRLVYEQINNDNASRFPVPNAPEFNTKIDLGKTPQTFVETLELFSKATGMPVFCDNFTNSKEYISSYMYTLNEKSVDIMKQGTIYDVLSSICKIYNLNVSYVNGHFDFNDIWWFNYVHSIEPASSQK